MPSSTSSSDSFARPSAAAARPARAVAWLVLLALLCLAGAEAGFRFLMRQSRIEQRIEGEQRAAERIRRSGSRRTVLVVGNSLLLEGIGMEELNQGLGPEWNGQRFVVDDTGYVDWYYAARLLIERGSRPDAIALAVAPIHLLVNRVRGEYFAHRLLLARDTPSMARDVNSHPTQTASYLFATFSEFYGVRAEVRKVLLGRMIPGLGPLVARLIASPAEPGAPEGVASAVQPRLARFRETLAPYGVQFLVILIPVPSNSHVVAAVERAGAAAGVPVVAPFGAGDFARDDFRDGFHLTTEGARKYTARLIEPLRDVLSRTGHGDSGASVYGR